ncbi:MAG: hypothetical protein Q4B90_00780 [Eubacteriales bacterium]|nr:hypothetical protein [Eubacteriales bacterium]
MKLLLKLRRSLQKFYNKNAVLIRAVLKFLLALTVFQVIQIQFQSGNTIRDLLLTAGAAGICAFLSTNIISVVAGAFLLVNLASMSIEALGVGGAALFIIGLLYFGMGPKESASMLLMPVTLWLHIPCLIPVILGLTSGLHGALGIVTGTVLYYIVQIITGSNYMAVSGSDMNEILKNITGVMGELTQAKDMILMTVILLVVFLIVLMIRRMSVDYAWHFAIGAGIFSYILLTVIGILMLKSGESFVGMAIGSVVTVFAALGVQIFLFHVDYRRTERVQFEDDEYYYYVKAVPKIGKKKSSPQQMNGYSSSQQMNGYVTQQEVDDARKNRLARQEQNSVRQEQNFVRQRQNPSWYDAPAPKVDPKEQQRQEWLRRRTEQGGSRYDKRKGG